jgi:hypothetical protein
LACLNVPKAEVIGHQGEVGFGPDQTFGAGKRAGPNPVWLIRVDRLPGALVVAPITIVMVIPVEIEHIEQVFDCRKRRSQATALRS